MADRQIEQAYRWQDIICVLDHHCDDLTDEQLYLAFFKLSRAFKLKHVFLKLLPKQTKMEYSSQLFDTVTLIPEHRNYQILCHEFAHLVVWKWYEIGLKRKIEAHGAEWLTVFMN